MARRGTHCLVRGLQELRARVPSRAGGSKRAVVFFDAVGEEVPVDAQSTDGLECQAILETSKMLAPWSTSRETA